MSLDFTIDEFLQLKKILHPDELRAIVSIRRQAIADEVESVISNYLSMERPAQKRVERITRELAATYPIKT